MHYRTLLSFLFAGTILGHKQHWGGINCKGSSFCGNPLWGGIGDEHREGYRDMIDQLRTMMITSYRIPACRTPPGEAIVCRANYQGAVCATLQHTKGGKLFPAVEIHEKQQTNIGPGLNGSEVIFLLEQLRHYGCRVCGSVPVGYPHNNDPDKYGVLTVNYIHYGLSPYPDGVQYDCEDVGGHENYYSNPFKKHGQFVDHSGY